MDETRLAGALLQLLLLVFSLCFHEFGHALAASSLGDKTARMLGRVTMDPRAHVDPVGTLFFPFLMILYPGLPLIGWAKPVPVTEENFSHPRRDMILVALAGPAMNILLVILSILALVLLNQTPYFQQDGGASPTVLRVLFLLIFMNFFLAVFNLIPIPPLDGGWLLKAVLPGPLAYKVSRMEPYSVFLLWALLYFRVLNLIFMPFAALLEGVLVALGLGNLGLAAGL